MSRRVWLSVYVVYARLGDHGHDRPVPTQDSIATTTRDKSKSPRDTIFITLTVAILLRLRCRLRLCAATLSCAVHDQNLQHSTGTEISLSTNVPYMLARCVQGTMFSLETGGPIKQSVDSQDHISAVPDRDQTNTIAFVSARREWFQTDNRYFRQIITMSVERTFRVVALELK